MSNDSDGDVTSEVHNEVHVEHEQDHGESTEEHHNDDEQHDNPDDEQADEHDENRQRDHETDDNQQHDETQESTDDQSLDNTNQQSTDNTDEQSTDNANEQSLDEAVEQSSEPSADLEQTMPAPVEREQLDDLNDPNEAVTYQSDDHVEPSSPSFVVEHQHMDTQTLETTSDQHSPSDAQSSPHSSVSTPRNVASDTTSDTSDPQISQQLIVVDSVIKVIAPLPPRQCTLVVTTDEGVVNVEVLREYLSSKRQFLGGYRGHKSGRVTLHASTQTAWRRTKPIVEKSERTTQTVATVNRAQQTLTSVATQMDRRDWCPVDDPTAFKPIYLEPRPAVSAETIEAIRDSNAKAIQCWLRVCFAHRRKAQLQQARTINQSITEAETTTAITKRHEQQQAQIERRMHPQSAADFALLQSELQAWRHHETHRIQSLQLDEEEKDRQLATLLSKEVKLLQTIDRLKLAAAKQRKAREVTERLTAMSSPLDWSNSASGTKVHVITPNIERAKAMVDLYRALQLPLRIDRSRQSPQPQEESKVELQQDVVQKGTISWEDRLDILLHVKYTAKEQLQTGSKVCGELVKLIEREEEWMTRRMLSPAVERVNDQGQCLIMDGLRTRITALFLQLVNDPTFNPHVAQFPVC